MADPHGHTTSTSHDSHDHAHDHAPEEDVVRTPLWLPFVGLGLLLLGVIGTYMWIYPGTANTRAVEDGGADAGSVEAAAPTAAPVAPARALPMPSAPTPGR